MKTFEKKKLKIEEDKQRLFLKEKILKDQEKKKRAVRFSEIGRLAYKADIDQLDNDILLGAFLEMSNNINEAQTEKWKRNAELFIKAQSESDSIPLTIKFKTDPEKTILNELSKIKFRWNRFLKIYYGKGNRKEVETLLQECHYQINEIND